MASPNTIRPRAALPQELQDLIIDFVPRRNGVDVSKPSTTLLSCHLVSIAFCRRARTRLFKEIWLTLYELDSSNLAKFLQIVRPDLPASAPEWLRLGIAPYIQTFHIMVEQNSSSRSPQIIQASDQNEELSMLLKSLHGPGYGVRKLSFMGGMLGERWDKFPPRVLDAFRDLFSSPTLSSLGISHASYFSTALLSQASIQELDVSGSIISILPIFHHAQSTLSTNHVWQQVNARASWSIEPKERTKDFYNTIFPNVRSISYLFDDDNDDLLSGSYLFEACRDTVEKINYFHSIWSTSSSKSPFLFSILIYNLMISPFLRVMWVTGSRLSSLFVGKFKNLRSLMLGLPIGTHDHFNELNAILTQSCDVLGAVGTDSLQDIQFDFYGFGTSNLDRPHPTFTDEMWAVNWKPLRVLNAVSLHPDFTLDLTLRYYVHAPGLLGSLGHPRELEATITRTLLDEVSLDRKHFKVNIYVREQY